MAKNTRKYADRPHANKPNRNSRSSLCLAFLCGYILANYVDVDKIAHWANATWKRRSTNEATQKSTQKTAAEKLPKPKFEFYSLLSQEPQNKTNIKLQKLPPEEVRQISKAIQRKVRDAVPLAPIQSRAAKKYDVQLASYNKKIDADRLKASLLLRDYNAHLEHIGQKNQHWYRVVIGPYKSKREAEKAQLSIARSERIMGIIRKFNS